MNLNAKHPNIHFSLIFLIALILFPQQVYAKQPKYTISGYVFEKGSKELLVGVNVYIPELQSGVTTNNYGFYSITLPKSEYTIYYSFVGYETVEKKLRLDKDIELNIEITGSIELKGIVVTSDRKDRISRESQMSKIEIPVMHVKNLPAFLGEKDVLKTLQLMPGVQSGSEGNSGIYVRGGGPDQNLIILDDAPVYNANHLFGFFSIFNGDALKSISLTKGGFPARYGGRLSSVLEMNMKDGNKEKFSGEAGIGLISSRLMLEGPIIKNKASYLISGRRTYIDILTRPLMTEEEKGGYFFYDFTAKANYDFGRKNKLYLSGYFGRDKFSFKYNDDGDKGSSGIYWGNATGTVRWNHLFNKKIFSNTSLIFSDYIFSIFSEDSYDGEDYELRYSSGIRDIGIKYDMQLHFTPQYFIRTGFSATYHEFRPSAVLVKDESIDQYIREVNTINTVESGVYIENEIKLWNKLRMNAGVRVSHYHHKNKSYLIPEPRFTAGYSFANDLSFKASYASMNQYVHLLSSTGISLPLDLWVPTTDKVKPQHSEQFAAGFAKDFSKQNFSLSLEGYYKKMDDIIGYAPGANFLLLDVEDPEDLDEFAWEETLIRGQGWSYGAELLLQRKVGKLSGWVGYTLSWTKHQFDEDNAGKKFFARYDRRHDISVVAIYNLSEKVTLSSTWVYGTGNAVSIPNAEFLSELNIETTYLPKTFYAYSYGEKNSYRMRSYHRLDIGLQFHKKKRKSERTWEIGLYNAYSRKNPFFYEIDGEKLKQISIFPIIPSITYNIKF